MECKFSNFIINISPLDIKSYHDYSRFINDCEQVYSSLGLKVEEEKSFCNFLSHRVPTSVRPLFRNSSRVANFKDFIETIKKLNNSAHNYNYEISHYFAHELAKFRPKINETLREIYERLEDLFEDYKEALRKENILEPEIVRRVAVYENEILYMYPRELPTPYNRLLGQEGPFNTYEDFKKRFAHYAKIQYFEKDQKSELTDKQQAQNEIQQKEIEDTKKLCIEGLQRLVTAALEKHFSYQSQRDYYDEEDHEDYHNSHKKFSNYRDISRERYRYRNHSNERQYNKSQVNYQGDACSNHTQRNYYTNERTSRFDSKQRHKRKYSAPHYTNYNQRGKFSSEIKYNDNHPIKDTNNESKLQMDIQTEEKPGKQPVSTSKEPEIITQETAKHEEHLDALPKKIIDDEIKIALLKPSTCNKEAVSTTKYTINMDKEENTSQKKIIETNEIMNELSKNMLQNSAKIEENATKEPLRSVKEPEIVPPKSVCNDANSIHIGYVKTICKKLCDEGIVLKMKKDQQNDLVYEKFIKSIPEISKNEIEYSSVEPMTTIQSDEGLIQELCSSLKSQSPPSDTNAISKVQFLSSIDRNKYLSSVIHNHKDQNEVHIEKDEISKNALLEIHPHPKKEAKIVKLHSKTCEVMQNTIIDNNKENFAKPRKSIKRKHLQKEDMESDAKKIFKDRPILFNTVTSKDNSTNSTKTDDYIRYTTG